MGDARCEMCGGQWHGLPKFDGATTCPGGWSSDDDKVVWRKMFPKQSSTQWWDSGGWKVSEIAESKVCSREYNYDRESFKVALYGAESNIQYVDDYRHATHELPSCNGYVTGGQSIGLREVVGRNYEVYFRNSPTWSATGTLCCRYAAVWIVRESRCDVIASTELAAQDIIISCGNTLTIDSSTRPLFTSGREERLA